MTRIIGGSASGRRLRTPSGDRTRPTTDRVREALFSALESQLGSLGGSRFLDLYAGSGAVGLEAMSRGALAATLVEGNRRTAATVVRPNAADLGFSAEVLALPVARALARPVDVPYDVVFADPPYDLGAEELVGSLALLVDGGWLAPDGVLVVERSRRTPEPAWPSGLVRERVKEYGETVLWWARLDTEPPQQQR